METVQGYVILKAATFETGHGFALGHNPGAPSPFVVPGFSHYAGSSISKLFGGKKDLLYSFMAKDNID